VWPRGEGLNEFGPFDKDQRRAARPFAETGLDRVLVKFAALTMSGGPTQRFEV
jgi:hypothetical protein